MIVHRWTWHNTGWDREQEGPVVLERPGRFLRQSAGSREAAAGTRGADEPAASVEQRAVPEAWDGIGRCPA